MAGRPQSILVVDDEPIIAAAIRHFLEAEGHQVTCFLDSRAALQRIEEQSFDLLITDMLMPEVDGPQLIGALRKLNRTTAVIAMSGGGTYVQAGDVITIAKKLGASAVLEKPFTAQELLACVDRAITPVDGQA